MSENAILTIDYYSDILCVWAWIAHRRNEELEAEWKDKISFHYRFVSVFGNTAEKIGIGWKDRGGFEGFNEHVLHASAPYEDAPVNRDIWLKVRPATSANAHAVLKGIELMAGEQVAQEFGVRFRRAFFVDNLDIGNFNVLFDIAGQHELNVPDLQRAIATGEASAALMADYHHAQELNVKGSPTWILNNGRQVLFGNVGYRVLNANISELMKHPAQEASWC